MKRIVYTDPQFCLDEFGRFNPELATIERRIVADKAELVLGAWNGSEFAVDARTLEGLVSSADVVVVGRIQISSALVQRLPLKCRLILKQGTGLDNIDVAAACERQVQVRNIVDYCSIDVATHALALMLAYERGIVIQDALIKSGQWQTFASPLPRRFSELTLGIVGLGRIGSALAEIATPLFREIVGYDRNPLNDPSAMSAVRVLPGFKDVLSVADYVSLHVDLNTTSRGMINSAALRHVRPSCVIVNCSRGAIVSIPDIEEAIARRTLGGYLADVFDHEPPGKAWVSGPLSNDRTLATCHCAFLSDSSWAMLRTRTIEMAVAAIEQSC